MALFSLDKRLDNDCITVGNFPLCRLLLMNDASYPWFILVPRIAGLEELYELTPEQLQHVMAESSILSKVLQRLFNGDKLNVAALGNIVRQLHIHHVVRFSADQAWPDPVWGRFPAKPYPTDRIAPLIARIGEALGDRFIVEKKH